MTLTDLLDADPEQINQESIGTQLEKIQNSVEAAMEGLQTSVEDIESKNKEDFDSELKITIQDILLYGKKTEFLLQIAKSLLTEYKNQQGWETTYSVDQNLLTVYEELVDENDKLAVQDTVEKIHLGITGEDLLAYINGNFNMDDVSEVDLDSSLSDVVNDELDITKIENTEDPVKKKIIWQATVLDVISSGVFITEMRDELKEAKSRAFNDITFEFYSDRDLMDEIDVEDLNHSLGDWDVESPSELDEEDIELDDTMLEDTMDDDS